MVNKRRIYQVYCGRWQEANWRDHPGEVLKRLANVDWLKIKTRLDLSHIYLLGLWDVGERIVVNEEAGVDLKSGIRCPSAFAIINHTQVWPRLGNVDDLVYLIKVLKQAGLGVYVDFVANHTGLDHRWVRNKPNWYKQSGQGLKTAFSNDVVELNYAVDEVNQTMVEVAAEIANYGVDGFRCDMAHLVPDFFWKRVIAAIRSKRPNFSFIAEAYGQSVFDNTYESVLTNAGFDGVYDGGLYQNLRLLSNGKPLDWLVAHLNYVISERKSYLVHYLSNHDDGYRLSQTSFTPLLALLSSLRGSTLIYNGSDLGFMRRLAHHRFDILASEYIDGGDLDNDFGRWSQVLRKPGFEVQKLSAISDQVLRMNWLTDVDRGIADFDLKYGRIEVETG